MSPTKRKVAISFSPDYSKNLINTCSANGEGAPISSGIALLHTIIFLSRIAGQFVYIQRDNLISIFKSTPRSIGIYTAITFIDGSRKQTNDISNSYVAYSACPYGRLRYVLVAAIA